MPISAETLVNSAELALVLDLSPRHVTRMAADGELPTAGKGRFRLVDAVRAYFDRKLAGDPNAVARLATARAAKEEHLAGLRALELDQRRGALLDRDEIVGAYQALVATCRAKLLAIPSRVAPELVGIDEPSEIQALLTDLVHEALAELADGR